VLERGDVSEMLAEAKLRSDLGRSEEAARLCRAVADERDAPAAVRGEALARLGATLRALGRDDEALAAFREALDDFGQDPEVLRFLSLAVDGVLVTPEVARRGATLQVDGAGARPTLRWGAETDAGCGGPWTGQPISIDVKSADLEDLFRLFAEVGGLNIVLGPCARGQVITLRLADVPWDQALSLVVRSRGWRCRLDGNVLTISCVASGDAARPDAPEDAVR
jgi:tetratricopeptide (TPR) repeat protein